MNNPTQHHENKADKALHKILRFTITSMLVCASYITAYVITEANLPNLPQFITTGISILFMAFNALILYKKTRLKVPRVRVPRPAKVKVPKRRDGDNHPTTQTLEIINPVTYNDEYGLRGIHELNNSHEEFDDFDYSGHSDLGRHGSGLQGIHGLHGYQGTQGYHDSNVHRTNTINRITINLAKFIGYNTILFAIMTGLNRIVYG